MRRAVRTTEKAPLLIGVAAFSILLGCSDDAQGPPQEPSCLDEPANAECTNPLFMDTSFPNLYARLLEPRCASGPCHSAETTAGGLSLADQGTAHEDLLSDGSDGRPRVIPRDVQCGKLIVRVETPGEEWSMPRGSMPLSDEALCMIRHWIADGATP